MSKLMSIALLITTAAPAWAGHMGGGHSGCGSGKSVVYFLTLALGYWLLRIAETEKGKLLKWVGRAVSWILLLGSLCGLFCGRCGKGGTGGTGCPYSGPMGPQSAPPPPAQ